MDRAREISSLLLEKFDQGLLKKIYIVYTDMENSLNSEAISTRILPFHRGHFMTPDDENAGVVQYEFEPSVRASYVSGFIYSALVDSFCSEQNARMNAMSAANDNAEELLEGLSTEYNRIRQSKITQEITEIIGGAAAVQKRD